MLKLRNKIWSRICIYLTDIHKYSQSSENRPPVIVRIKKTSKVSHRREIISWNDTNNQLFGPIISKRKSKSKASISNPLSKGTKGTRNYFTLSSNWSYLNTREQIPKFTSDSHLFKQISSATNAEEIMLQQYVNPQKIETSFTKMNESIKSMSIFEGGYKKLPSVRKILEHTMPPERKIILEKWEKKMIKKLGEQGFQIYRQGLLDQGSNFHRCIELKLRKEELQEEQLVGLEEHWKSLKNVLSRITDVRVLESRVIHPSLQYQGSVDCVGFYKKMPVVIEFKTSSKPKLTLSDTYDDPLQVAAYIGALNHDSSYDLPNIDDALLVIAYPTGLPAHVHRLGRKECLNYWNLWCQRLALYWKEQNNDTSLS